MKKPKEKAQKISLKNRRTFPLPKEGSEYLEKRKHIEDKIDKNSEESHLGTQ